MSVTARLRAALSKQTDTQIQETFAAVDGPDGNLTRAELLAALRKLGFVASADELNDVFEAFESSGSGKVSRAEFLEFARDACADAASGDSVTGLLNRVRGVLLGMGEAALDDVFQDCEPRVGLPAEQFAVRLAEIGVTDVRKRDVSALVTRIRNHALHSNAPSSAGAASTPAGATDVPAVGHVTRASMVSFLDQRVFELAVTRILHAAAVRLRAHGSSLRRVLVAAAKSEAKRSGIAMAPAAAADANAPVALTPASLRTALVDTLDLPLSGAQLAAICAMGDLDGDGTCDVAEVCTLAGEEAGGDTTLNASGEASEDDDADASGGSSDEEELAAARHAFRVGPAGADHDADLGFDVAAVDEDDEWIIGTVNMPVPASVLPPPPPVAGGIALPGLAAAAATPAAGASTAAGGVVPTPAVVARMAAITAGASRLPATPWVDIVRSVFTATAAAGALPVGTGGVAGGLPVGIPTSIAGAVTALTPALPSTDASGAASGGRPTMDARRMGQALAALGLRVPAPSLPPLLRRHDPAASGLIDGETFCRVVDDITLARAANGRHGLSPLAEGRVRAAVRAAVCGQAVVPRGSTTGARMAGALATDITGGNGSGVATMLVSRHHIAEALASHCALAGLTPLEAIAVAALAPGSLQQHAASALAPLVTLQLLPGAGGSDGGAAGPSPTGTVVIRASTASMMSAFPLASPGALRPGISVSDGSVGLGLAVPQPEALAAAGPLGGGAGALTDPRAYLLYLNAAAAAPGRTLAAAAAAGAAPCDIHVDGFISWLRAMAAAGAGVEQVARAVDHSHEAAAALAAVAGASAAASSALSLEEVEVRLMAAAGGSLLSTPEVAAPVVASTDPATRAAVYAYCALPDVVRSGIRKLVSPVLALPVPVACITATSMQLPLPTAAAEPAAAGMRTSSVSAGPLPPAIVTSYAMDSFVVRHMPRLPMSYTPSTLAPAACTLPAASIAGVLMDGGGDSRPGHPGTSHAQETLAAAVAAAVSVGGLGATAGGALTTPPMLRAGAASGGLMVPPTPGYTPAPTLALPSPGAGTTGMMSVGGATALAPAGSLASPSAALALMAPAAASTTAGGAVPTADDGLGLSLQWTSLLPGTDSTAPTACIPTPGARLPSGASADAPRLRLVGAAAIPQDMQWAADGFAVRPLQSTVVLDLASVKGVPSPVDEGVRGQIVARQARVAIVDLTAPYSLPSAPPPPTVAGVSPVVEPCLSGAGIRLLSNVTCSPATWSAATEDEWSFEPHPGQPASRLVLRCDAPRDAGGPTSAIVLVELTMTVRRPGPLAAAPGAPSGVPLAQPSSPYVAEEIAVAWGMVPLSVLAGPGSATTSTGHRLKLAGGAPGAAMDVVQGDILQRRSAWRAIGKRLTSGAVVVPEMAVNTRALSRLAMTERMVLGALPFTCAIPFAWAATIAAWRRATAAVLLHRARSTEPFVEQLRCAPELAAAAAMARSDVFACINAPASSSAFASLVRMFEAELQAASKRRPVPSPQDVFATVALRAWPALASSGVDLGLTAGTPVAAALSETAPRWAGVAPHTAFAAADTTFAPFDAVEVLP